jgi:LPPG:FO 2-phospho-L-lactate transferase
VLDVKITGLEKGNTTKEVMEALASDDNVIIGPSNPITSIGPILGLKGMRKLLSGKNVIAVSPIIGDAPVSGPAGKLMRAQGYPVSSKGVADCYGDTADGKDFPVISRRCDTMMTSVEKSEALARCVLELFDEL